MNITPLLQTLLVGASIAANSTSSLVTIDTQWRFRPTGSAEWFSFYPGRPLSNQLPDSAACCVGIAAFSTTELAILKSIDSYDTPALLLPEIGGAKAVWINGQKLQLDDSDYSSKGIVAVIQKGATHLTAEIEIDSPKSSFAGPWNSKPKIGELGSIIDQFFWTRLRQQVLPAALALIFIVLAATVGPPLLFSNNYRHLFWPFVLYLTGWSIFFLFLFGAIRHNFPTLGSIVHFPFRLLVGGLQFYFLASLAKIDSKKVSKVAVLFGAVFCLQLFIGTQFGPFQTISYSILNLSNFYALYCLVPSTRRPGGKLLFALTLIADLGQLSDSIKLVAQAFSIGYQPIFLSRFCTPPLLFYSVVFVAQALINESERSDSLEQKRLVYRRIGHDLKSPVAALRFIQKSLSGESRDLSVHVIDRITAIYQTLKSEGAVESTKIELNECIQLALSEARIECLQKNKTLETQVAVDSTDMSVIANKSDLLRVFSNILNNSLDASSEQVVQIKITAQQHGKITEVVFSDTCSEITDHVLKNLGVDHFTYNKAGGSGLGLGFVKAAMGSWGGSVVFQKSNPRGLTVRLRFGG